MAEFEPNEIAELNGERDVDFIEPLRFKRRWNENHYKFFVANALQTFHVGDKIVSIPTMVDRNSNGNPEPLTELLSKMREGDAQAAEQFTIAVYRELRRLAKRYMRQERDGHSLQTTGLVHEAYLRLLGNGPIDWTNGSHFFATASTVMRCILVDYARMKGAQRRGGGATHVLAEDHVLPSTKTNWDRILDVDRALNEFALIDPRAVKVVELRFFSGLSEDEAARILGVCTRTVKRDWESAQAWLYGRLGEGYGARGASA